jgi:hypothetical protein
VNVLQIVGTSSSDPLAELDGFLDPLFHRSQGLAERMSREHVSRPPLTVISLKVPPQEIFFFL